MAEKKTGISRELLIHPGETIRDVIEDRNISQSELAASTGMTSAFISKVISGKKGISNQLAVALEYALDIPKSFWLNLQKNYDAELLEIEEQQSITDTERALAKELEPVVKHFRNLSGLPSRLTVEDKVLLLRKHLQISNLENLSLIAPEGSFRKASNTESNPAVMGAWLRMAQIATEGKVSQHKFSANDAEGLVVRLKEIMRSVPVGEYVESLRAVMAEYGISFAVIQHFPGAPINGYVTKGANGTLRVAVTIRQSYEDVFWFSILHEIGHIVNGDLDRRKGEFLDDESDADKESAANIFARDALINPSEYEFFLEASDRKPTLGEIMVFAIMQNVTSGIVVGRLMNDGVIPWSKFAAQRRRLTWE